MQWYRERSETAAERFWDALIRARKQAAELPKIGTPYFEGTRVVPFRKFPYGLVYVERSDKIIGLAICHFSRRPRYWKRRLS